MAATLARAGDHAARHRRARAQARPVPGAGAVADLHRPSAAESADLVHDPQLRLQRRHRDLHLHLRLHRRLRLWPRHAGERLRHRHRAHPAPGLADLCRPRLPVHDLPRRDLLRRDQLREPALHRRDGDHGFPQAARRHHRAGAAVALPSRQHGRAAAVYRADAGAAADPVVDEVAARRDARALGSALRGDLGIRPLFLGLSERLLGVQSARLAIAVRVRGMVRARRCATHVAYSGVTA